MRVVLQILHEVWLISVCVSLSRVYMWQCGNGKRKTSICWGIGVFGCRWVFGLQDILERTCSNSTSSSARSVRDLNRVMRKNAKVTIEPERINNRVQITAQFNNALHRPCVCFCGKVDEEFVKFFAINIDFLETALKVSLGKNCHVQ